MIRRWMGAAVVAGWLGLAAAAPAQYLPSPVGAARIMPEPLPCGAPPAPTPNLVPGPVSPAAAPPGPCDQLSLPANHASAFQCENFGPEVACYASLGAMALQRQQLGAGAIAVFDNNSNMLDTGFSALPNAPIAQRFKDLVPGMNWGVRGTVGYMFNDQAVEVSAFYIFQQSVSQLTDDPGNLDVFFSRSRPPLGFEGDNGLWLQADRVSSTFQSELFNGELNYRCWNIGISGLECILGVRYLDERERLSIFTSDDDLVLAERNRPTDPKRDATYSVLARNHILAPQIGFDWNAPLWCFLSVGFDGKAAVGPNWSNTNVILQRGDGFVGINDHHNHVSLSEVFEAGFFLDFHIL